MEVLFAFDKLEIEAEELMQTGSLLLLLLLL